MRFTSKYEAPVPKDSWKRSYAWLPTKIGISPEGVETTIWFEWYQEMSYWDKRDMKWVYISAPINAPENWIAHVCKIEPDDW